MPKYGRLDPRMMSKLMKQMGKAMETLRGVTEVIIKTEKQNIRIINPQQVIKMTFGGQQMFQIVGGVIEEISNEEKEEQYVPQEEDIQLVAAQTGTSFEEAKAALIETKGDLAQAILLLKQLKK
ncbi:MAG: nascent polypeptide-associated complex protein [Candidatus Asgardarchaeia archaeon]